MKVEKNKTMQGQRSTFSNKNKSEVKKSKDQKQKEKF